MEKLVDRYSSCVNCKLQHFFNLQCQTCFDVSLYRGVVMLLFQLKLFIIVAEVFDYSGQLESCSAVQQKPGGLYFSVTLYEQHCFWSSCFRETDSMERHPAVWSSRDRKVVSGKGRGHRGQ